MGSSKQMVVSHLFRELADAYVGTLTVLKESVRDDSVLVEAVPEGGGVSAFFLLSLVNRVTVTGYHEAFASVRQCSSEGVPFRGDVSVLVSPFPSAVLAVALR